MAKNAEIFFTKNIRARGTKFLLADSTNNKQILAPSTEGTRLTAMPITSTSAAAKVGLVQINDLNQSLQFPMGHINIPASAGQGSVAAVSGMNRGNLTWLEIDAFGNPFINLNFNMTLENKLQAAVSGSEEVNFLCLGGDYDA